MHDVLLAKLEHFLYRLSSLHGTVDGQDETFSVVVLHQLHISSLLVDIINFDLKDNKHNTLITIDK